MPDLVLHHVFGQEVRALLSPEIRDSLTEAPYGIALYGPDLWFLYRPWKRRQGRGRQMHTTKTGDFLRALAQQARDGSSPAETFSYLAGFLCHYALDSTAHPYIVWQTTQVWTTAESHRDMEHALDALRLKREGHWGEPHPVTDWHVPVLRLPVSLSADLDTVYSRVYGWTGLVPALNACYRRARLVYRFMEKPHGLISLLAGVFPADMLRAFCYPRSAFLDRDVENLSHTAWHSPCDRNLTFTESFPELWEKARAEAVRMIEDCWRFAREGSLTGEQLKESLGNRSYLSGIDWEDARNQDIPGLQPPKEE